MENEVTTLVHFNPNGPHDVRRNDVVPFDAGLCGTCPDFPLVAMREVRHGEREPVYGDERSGFTHTRTRELVTCEKCRAAFEAFDAKRAASGGLFYGWLP